MCLILKKLCKRAIYALLALNFILITCILFVYGGLPTSFTELYAMFLVKGDTPLLSKGKTLQLVSYNVYFDRCDNCIYFTNEKDASLKKVYQFGSYNNEIVKIEYRNQYPSVCKKIDGICLNDDKESTIIVFCPKRIYIFDQRENTYFYIKR